MKYLNIIDSYYSDLTKSEKKVADYIKETGKDIIYHSVQEVTQSVGVGDATVIRFCKKIGFEGFQELKLQIATEDFSHKTPTFESYIDMIQNNFKEAIDKTITLIDDEVLNKAIDTIVHAQRILIYGVGASGIAAQEAQASFLRVGRNVKAVTDSQFQAMESATLGDKDVVIALSLSGRTKDTLDAISIAKKSNATVIAITNYALSPIAQLSDIVVSTAMKESLIDGGSLSAKVSQLFIIDILTTGFALKNKEKSIDLKQKIAKSILYKTKD
ncbi:SIS domain-containing protein [Gracilibacillus salitolerans]|uniref:SIS domain-containing protein n=1 Tax=Gracilibacillus salitolerans TaxID=2663022 RepID=A0A5Q2TPX6_9BACI|nr:MurR/RpiR family transcriptional regulator [Gracilibacillus salitolerans]QGH36231.1 SIS domain-containing protein [Gracilibacillus salitolerans]